MVISLIIWASIVGHAHLVEHHVEAGRAERAAVAARVMCLNDYAPACDELERS